MRLILVAVTLAILPLMPVAAGSSDEKSSANVEAGESAQTNPYSGYRNIPGASQFGVLRPPGNSQQWKINGKNYTPAFNYRIRDEGNRIIPAYMIRTKKRVRYILNDQGEVDKIWLLTIDEQ